MSPAMLAIILAVIEACGKYGVPLVTGAIAALNKTEITEADILNLKITKEPEEF
jgi:hypothetical protein